MLGPPGWPGIAPALLPAVDGQNFPGNEFARGGCEIDAGFGHIPDVSCSPQRVGFRIGFETLGWIVGETGGLEHARGNAVDANAKRRPLHGYALRQVSDPGPGGSRMGDARHAAPEVGDNIDNRSRRLVLDPRPRTGLHHVPGAIEVVVNHCRPTLGFEVERWLRELATGIVDENIEATTLAPDVGDIGRTARD